MPVAIDYFDAGALPDTQLTYAIIIAAHRGQWLLVRHKSRRTWEVPGGHIEPGETADAAARRELFEETGALNFNISRVCDYSVRENKRIGYGRLYAAHVKTLGPLPESEIAEVRCFDALPKNLTYPAVQPALLARYLNTR